MKGVIKNKETLEKVEKIAPGAVAQLKDQKFLDSDSAVDAVKNF